jgi:hypothetical protein
MAKKIQKLKAKVEKENASIKKYTDQIKELEAKKKKSIEERDAARLKIYDILAGGRSLEELESALSDDDDDDETNVDENENIEEAENADSEEEQDTNTAAENSYRW